MQEQQPNPAQIPQPPQPPAPGMPAPVIYRPGDFSGPRAVLEGARAAREELGNQLERLEERRQGLVQELRRGGDGVSREGLERRISSIDERIIELERQITTADDAVARAAAIPGATIEPPDPPEPFDPDAAMQNVTIVSTVFTMFVLAPLAVAYARRLWRRGTAAVAELPKVLADRLTRLDQAVDAIAVEVERISEGQRFLTKVMSDQAGNRALGGGAAQPIEVPAREHVGVPRSQGR
jgi:hypothetical protein